MARKYNAYENPAGMRAHAERQEGEETIRLSLTNAHGMTMEMEFSLFAWEVFCKEGVGLIDDGKATMDMILKRGRYSERQN